MTHWRFSQHPVRFGLIDYRAGFLFLGLIMHCRLWTLYACLIGIFILVLCEYKGLTVPMAFSRLRYLFIIFLTGSMRPGCSRPKRQRFLKGLAIINLLWVPHAGYSGFYYSGTQPKPTPVPINIDPKTADDQPLNLPSSATLEPIVEARHSCFWRAQKGRTLRQVLEQWVGQEGIDLEWATEFDYPLASSFVSSLPFTEALTTLLEAFKEASPQPYGRLYNNGEQALLLIQARGKE